MYGILGFTGLNTLVFQQEYEFITAPDILNVEELNRQSEQILDS